MTGGSSRPEWHSGRMRYKTVYSRRNVFLGYNRHPRLAIYALRINSGDALVAFYCSPFGHTVIHRNNETISRTLHECCAMTRASQRIFLICGRRGGRYYSNLSERRYGNDLCWLPN